MYNEKIKEFLDGYLELNKVDYDIDKNNIYTLKFKDILANKLGKQRKFSFNRTVSDDYGVEHMSLNNDVMKYIIRDCINKGLLVKAKLNTKELFQDKLNLDKNIFIKKQVKNKDIAIAFLFKITSNNRITENTPEFLKYVIIGYDDMVVFSEDLSSEFHNMILTGADFKFDAKNVDKAHTTAYETLRTYLEYKYSEHESANEKIYEQRKRELKDRHEQILRDCKIEEKKLVEKIEEKEDRIQRSRTYDAQDKYRKDKKEYETRLSKLKEENQRRIEQDHYLTEKRIEEEKEKYVFEISTHLISAVVFEYETLSLMLSSTISNEEAEIKYNLLTNKIQEYICPLCKNNSQSILLSINGHFCCQECSTPFTEKETYLCKKDNAEKCVISGNFIPKTDEYMCESCEKYFDKYFLKKDVLGKKTCELCIKKTYKGEAINKKDAMYSKKYNAYFKPKEVNKCEYSNEWYPLRDLERTTGSDRLISKEFVKTCKISGLTFAPDEMNKERSLLICDLKERSAANIKYPDLKRRIDSDKVEYNENRKWAIVKVKAVLRTKYILYNIKEKKIETLIKYFSS